MAKSIRDPEITTAINQLLALVDEDPGELKGELIHQMINTALRLSLDGAAVGERKLIANSFRELRYAHSVFREYQDVRKVSIFGSARTPSDNQDYRQTVDFSRRFANEDWMVITGAGPGIMQAGHEGAGREKSFGVSIRLPFESGANEVILDDPKLITFRYFFTRKLMFVSQADALGLFPGGYGTLDEAFEVLTLIQTGKSPVIPVVLLAPRGNDYWHQFDRYVREQLLAKGLISEEDLHLYHIFDDANSAASHVFHFYRNYHSQRFVGDRMVFRIQQPLTDLQLDELNNEFSDLVEEGKYEQSSALEGEDSFLDMPRLVFAFARSHYGRIRQLIDRVNEFATYRK